MSVSTVLTRISSVSSVQIWEKLARCRGLRSDTEVLE